MCDTVVVVREDRVLFAKNSDRDPNEAQILEWHPPRKGGRRVRCTHVEVPDVDETLPVLLSRPYWMWGAEMGLNARGVVIGNEAVFTTAALERAALTGMDVLRLALERAPTASDAVTVIEELVRAHGQGGPMGHEAARFAYSSSFIVADAGSAFVVETAGRAVAVERVTSGARSISNGLTIPDFRARHARALHGWVAACDVRSALTQRMASTAREARDLFPVVRSHGDTTWPTYSAWNGTLRFPCMHGGGGVASSQTTATLVVELAPAGARAFATATSAPCLGIMKPVAVAVPVDLGAAPTDVDDGASLWWRHERLHRRTMRDPERVAACFVDGFRALEAELYDAAPGVEPFARASAALDDANRAVDAQGPIEDVRPRAARRAWARRERQADGASLRPAWSPSTTG